MNHRSATSGLSLIDRASAVHRKQLPKWPSKITQGHGKCHGSIDRICMVSHYRPIVAMAVSCRPLFAAYSQIYLKNREIYIPHLYSTPGKGCHRQNFAWVFGSAKTRMTGLKKVWYVKPFRYIPERDRRTESLYRASALLRWRTTIIKRLTSQAAR